ncbi:hypothetical protein GCM10010458_34610 [Microbacterium luteolum]
MRPVRPPPRAYRGGMARVGGRNLAMSWVAGVICAGIIGALVWFSIPILPVLAEFAGDALRSALP